MDEQDHAPRAPSNVQLSAKMMEAQAYFQRIVKQELQVLLSTGLEREVAVKMLLHRIVESTQEPEENDVKRVMRQFQMNYDDAVRALIVKQEIGRLKKQGLDAFAAIEELTRKMQRIRVPENSDEEENDSNMEEPANEDSSDHAEISVGEAEEVSASDTVGSADEVGQNELRDQEKSTGCETKESESPPPGAAEVETKESPANTYLSSLIDQVSISSSPPAQTNAERDPTQPLRSLATVHSVESSHSEFALFSSHSRKRRVNVGSSSPSSENEEKGSASRSSTSTTYRPHLSIHRPMSPTFRFPISKKQKIWTEDENEEPAFDASAFKSTSIIPPTSPTAVSTHEDTPPSSTSTTPTMMGKRRRAVRGASSPELDDIVDEAIIRVSKRHKMWEDHE